LVAPSPGAQADEWSSSITFFLNGKKITLEASQVHPRMMLSEYLREHTQLTGTKVRGKHQQFYTTSCAVAHIRSCLTAVASCHVAVALP
jgi:aerobic-type carbon monoxide dehydrogenase small subunit (CoxS/CutS family)